jgi:hypothetical protein
MADFEDPGIEQAAGVAIFTGAAEQQVKNGRGAAGAKGPFDPVKLAFRH